MSRLDGEFSPLRKDIKHHLKHMSEAEITLFVGYLCCPIQERAEADGTITGITDPTIEQLAEILPIGRTTIIYAKQALAARGFIRKVGKSRVEIPKYKKIKGSDSELSACGKLANSSDSELSSGVVNNSRIAKGSKVEPYSSDSEPQGSKVEPSKEEKELLTTPSGTRQANRTELESLQTLKGVKAYPFEFETDLDHLRGLSVDFPDTDIHAEIKKWATYKLDKPLSKKSNPRLQLRNWMEKARQFRGGGTGEPAKPEPLNAPTPGEAWLNVVQAMRNGTKTTPLGHPAIIKAVDAVGGLQVLRESSTMETDIKRGQFLKIYPDLARGAG